ncbi:MAG: protoporphyrinogen oxidase [Rhodospirillaceae bacterium]|nr:protoporphyrinogen oxidase [Rhodospirillaceae bacterium]MBL6940922.1 protoporphyrinogen oxidase [Rhodospirillales bacterium]
MSFDVAIIGGGVSGLSAAYDLSGRGYKVVVLERQVRSGGNAQSERIDGFLMEHGPSSINAQAMESVGLSRDLGLESLRTDLGAQVKSRYLVGDGRLQGISTHPLGFLMSGYLSPLARLRLMFEIAVPRYNAQSEETITEFWSRRFGREFTDKVIDPLVAGLYAGKADDLSVNAVFPSIVAMEKKYGSISRAVLSKRFASGKMPGRRLFSWMDGIGTLPSALASQLGGTIRTNVVVTSITRSAKSFEISTAKTGTLSARAVIVATQPHVSASLLEAMDGPAAEAISEISAPPIAVAFLGYKRNQVDHPLDGLGFLAPAGENRPLSGALFPSSMFKNRAPEGHVAMSGYVGGARAPEMALMPAEDITALARDEFRDLLGAKGEPVVARVRQWSQGLPQLTTGHGQRLQRIHDAEQRHPGLFVTGNYFTGPAVATCLTQSLETSSRVHGYLGGRNHFDEHEQAAMFGSAYA